MAFVVSVGLLAASRELSADEPTPVVVTMGGNATLRVEVAEGRTTPCDSSNNRALFNSRMKPGDSFRASIGGECVCVRHTTAAFPETEWTTSGLQCRRRICRGRICKPAPDPTIRVSLP